MRRLVVVLIVSLCVAGVVSAADPQLVGLMMQDAKVLAGVNVGSVKNSPFGQYLLSQAPTGDQHFQQFVQATGFDPTRDITEIVAASAGNAGQQAGLVAARGTFDAAHIMAFLETVGATVDRSGAVPVVTSPDGKGAFAFLDNTLAVAGDLQNVLAAIGRKSAPSALDPALAEKGQALSQAQDAWVVSTVTPGSVSLPNMKGGPGGLNLSALQAIQQASAGVKFLTTINVTAEAIADTAQNANALADVVRLLVSLAQMNQSDPHAAQAASILKTLTIQTKGTALELSLAIPEALFEQLSPANHHGAHRAELRAK
jgi:hypothetical protein